MTALVHKLVIRINFSFNAINMVAIVTTIYHHHDRHHESNWIRLYCLFVLASDALDPPSFYYYS